MTTARFACVALVCAAALCAASSPDRTAPYVHRGPHGARASREPLGIRREGPVRLNLPKPAANDLARSAPAANRLVPRGPGGSFPGARGVSNQRLVSGKHPAVPAPGPTRTVAPPLSNVRHRGVNPPVITGSADPGRRNAAAIDGRQVARRP